MTGREGERIIAYLLAIPPAPLHTHTTLQEPARTGLKNRAPEVLAVPSYCSHPLSTKRFLGEVDSAAGALHVILHVAGSLRDCSLNWMGAADCWPTRIWTARVHLYADLFSINTAHVFPLPYDVLNIFFSLAYFVVIQYIIHSDSI